MNWPQFWRLNHVIYYYLAICPSALNVAIVVSYDSYDHATLRTMEVLW